MSSSSEVLIQAGQLAIEMDLLHFLKKLGELQPVEVDGAGREIMLFLRLGDPRALIHLTVLVQLMCSPRLAR